MMKLRCAATVGMAPDDRLAGALDAAADKTGLKNFHDGGFTLI
jgi:hypothetical protein